MYPFWLLFFNAPRGLHCGGKEASQMKQRKGLKALRGKHNYSGVLVKTFEITVWKFCLGGMQQAYESYHREKCNKDWVWRI